MKRLFAVIRARGSAWDPARPLEEQQEWDSHAAFMEALLAEGFVLLGGPLEGTPNVLLIIRAESAEEVRSRLTDDIWILNGLLLDVEITPWTLRLGSLGYGRRYPVPLK